jgi:hypothetical protein
MAEIIFGTLGLLLVALTLLQTARIHRQSTDAQIFLEFTSRFNALLEFQRILAHEDLKNSYKKSPAVDSAVCSYFDLLSQEYHLNQEKILRDKIWNVWQDDIKLIVDSPLMREAWAQTVHRRYTHHSDFCCYVESLMKNSAD